MYLIYKITSPSGRSYIGLTKSKLSERWGQHVKRAFSLLENKPLMCAIRLYGPGAFLTEQIDTAGSKSEAQALERKHIAAHSNLYNISPGGEADGETGAKVFWDAMAADPAAKAAYLKKLSAAKLENDWTDYSYLSARAKEWRKSNPKAAYYQSYRALRIANRRRTPKPPDTRTLKDRLKAKHKRGVSIRNKVSAAWAARDPGVRVELGAAISKGVKDHWASIKDPAIRSAKTAAARAAIDRSKQGPAASKGIKRFWEDLKKDPERYAKYMAERTASLMKTLGAA
jgi:hypothetical protein